MSISPKDQAYQGLKHLLTMDGDDFDKAFDLSVQE